jgi:hypothetical protein
MRLLSSVRVQVALETSTSLKDSLRSSAFITNFSLLRRSASKPYLSSRQSQVGETVKVLEII